MSKLRPSTFFWAFSIARLIMRCSIASPSWRPRRSIQGLMRSEPKMRSRSSSRERKNWLEPGSPWRPERPRSWLSMRRLSWRSVPRMWSPPAATTCVALARRRSRSNSRELQQVLGVVAVAAALGERQELGVAAEHDVGAAARHVGRDRDGAVAAGLGHDLGLALVLLRVQHLVADAALLELRRELLRVLDRDGADQDRLAGLVAPPSPRPRSRRTSPSGSCRPRREWSLRIIGRLVGIIITSRS